MSATTWWREQRARRLHDDGVRMSGAEDWVRAEIALRTAAGIREGLHGPRHHDTLASRLWRADALVGLGRADEAVAELSACIEDGGRASADVSQMVLEARFLRCRVLRKGPLWRDPRVEEDARAVATALAGRFDEFHLDAADRLGSVLGRLGLYAEAVAAVDGPIDGFADRNAADEPLLLRSRVNRGGELAYVGRFEEALEEWRGVMATIGTPRGPSQAYALATARSGLVFALCGLGRHAAAEGVARGALAEVAEGADLASFRATLRINLARSLNGQGRYEEAWEEVQAVRAALASDARKPSAEQSPLEVAAAFALLGLGRYGEAEAAAAEAVRCCREQTGAAHHRALEAGHAHAAALVAQGRPEAAGLLAANLAAWRAGFGDAHPGTRAAVALAGSG
ncbi:hypothetical protein [Kitasatospora sp. NPDC057015]|uniref:hypothetical protein n=1 Tax=Kitasatospora sp. NPDC057015 TaxID=3346001 RepID=UPI00362AE227